MNINRHNYEEFFLLYVDNELTAEQKKSVEQFIQENPDLAGELELFRQTSLVSDDAVVFEGKELLMKKENDSFITINNYEEYLVAYIDNELAPAERKEFEKFVALHPAVKEELFVFQQTKFQPAQEIIFSNKEILYRKEEKVRVITMSWWKIAVAAAVVLTIGITTFTVLTRNTTVPVDVAENKKNEQNNPAAIKPEKDTSQEEQNIPASIENNHAVASTNKATDKEKIVPVQKAGENKLKRKSVAPPTALTNDVVAKTNAPEKNIELSIGNNPVDKKVITTVTDKKDIDALHTTLAVNNTPAKQNNNSKTVTNDSVKPYDDKETAYDKTIDTGAVFASNNEEGKNKKLRGFFRKATRVFEKRTNISAADDEDKVLIGVLALRLK
ncbi:MAG: hypothetical protein JWM28_1942 [Chitinophagaceae bacterium]|nr:hypothetical protein [Chitinophagaceae bacterium]